MSLNSCLLSITRYICLLNGQFAVLITNQRIAVKRHIIHRFFHCDESENQIIIKLYSEKMFANYDLQLSLIHFNLDFVSSIRYELAI